jgi:ferredoxin
MPLNDPGGSGSLAWVPVRRVQNAIHAAEACPGECIFIELDTPDAELDVAVDSRIAARVELRPDAA